MLNMYRLKNQRGFSILEVLFAMVVLSIALLSIARMHALVTLDGGYSKARGIAVNLAQEKLDDLRAFTSVNTGCTAPVFCFTEIGANAGGRENSDGTLVIRSGDVPVGNTTYNRTWAVTDYYRCGISAPSTTNCTSPYTKSYPDFKVVVMTVAWTDEQGTARSVVMRATIHASGIVSEANVLAAPYGGGGPKVSYHPIGVPDAVPVPVNVGGTKQKESSKPVPDVSTSGKSKLVSFDVVTYDTSQSLGGGTYKTLRRETFYTVNCVCRYASGTSSQPTASRLVWDGTDLTTKVGGSVQKAYGVAHRTGTNSDPNQPAECDTCCAEHHDSESSDYAKYDPDRPGSDYYTTGNAEGDHKHYWWTSVGHPELGLTAVNGNANDVYLESCRFSKVNGIDYLWQDWRMVDLTAFDYNYLQNSTNLTAYQNYLVDKVKHEEKVDGAASGASVTATTNPTKPTGRNFTIIQGELRQILGRAVYLDKIYKSSSPTELDNDYYAAIEAKINASTDWLLYVPFYEANITLLDDWSSSNYANVPVTMQKVNTISDPATNYYGSYSRGRVTGLTAGTTETISTRALISNSGLTSGVYEDTGTDCPATAANCVSYGIDTQDNTTTLTDSISVSVAAAGSTFDISGVITKGTNGNILSGITITPTTISGVASCDALTVIQNQASYTCHVSVNWSGTLTPTKSNYVFDWSNTASPPQEITDGITSGSRTYTNVSSPISTDNYVICDAVSGCPNP
jgi:prepilin-type N-terminal cleavage/methylation domain-containing protein